MIKFPFFLYFLFSNFIINAIGEKARQDFRDFLIDTFEKNTLPTLSMKDQEKSKMYLSMLKQLPTKNFFLFMRLTKYNDFQIFLYLLDIVRCELEEDFENYKKKVGVK
jgi:hypothetical protein